MLSTNLSKSTKKKRNLLSNNSMNLLLWWSARCRNSVEWQGGRVADPCAAHWNRQHYSCKQAQSSGLTWGLSSHYWTCLWWSWSSWHHAHGQGWVAVFYKNMAPSRQKIWPECTDYFLLSSLFFCTWCLWATYNASTALLARFWIV